MIIRPRNWKTFQHYTDRRPAWIKLHRELLDNFEFQRLPTASRALAPMLWLLSSESDDATVDADHERLAFRLRRTTDEIAEALKPLIESAFFEVVEPAASKPLANDKREASSEREEEKRQRERETRAREVPRGTRDAGAGLTSMPSAEALLAELSDGWKTDVEGVNVVELQRFFDFAEKHPDKPKRYSATARLSLAKKLAGMGDAEHQRKVVEQSMSADHVVLYPLKDRPAPPRKGEIDPAKKVADESRDWCQLKVRAEAIGFRPRTPADDLIGYRTLLERAENAAPRSKRIRTAAELLARPQ